MVLSQGNSVCSVLKDVVLFVMEWACSYEAVLWEAIAHPPDRIVTYNKSPCYFTTTYSTSVYCFLATFQPPIRSSTEASDTIPSE